MNKQTVFSDRALHANEQMGEEPCKAEHPRGYKCTLLKGHTGRHVAASGFVRGGTQARVVGEWPDDR